MEREKKKKNHICAFSKWLMHASITYGCLPREMIESNISIMEVKVNKISLTTYRNELVSNV